MSIQRLEFVFSTSVSFLQEAWCMDGSLPHTSDMEWFSLVERTHWLSTTVQSRSASSTRSVLTMPGAHTTWPAGVLGLLELQDLPDRRDWWPAQFQQKHHKKTVAFQCKGINMYGFVLPKLLWWSMAIFQFCHCITPGQLSPTSHRLLPCQAPGSTSFSKTIANNPQQDKTIGLFVKVALMSFWCVFDVVLMSW